MPKPQRSYRAVRIAMTEAMPSSSSIASSMKLFTGCFQKLARSSGGRLLARVTLISDTRSRTAAASSSSSVLNFMLALSGAGCVEALILPLESVDTHHSAPRVRRTGRSPLRWTVVTSQRINSSPARQHSSSREVRITRLGRPLASMFIDNDVRLDSWKTWLMAGAAGVGRCVFMAAIVGRAAHPVHVQISEGRT